jgi:5,6-dimethylbenzimidazole synthase
LLHLPSGSKPIAILCLGRVPAFYPRPMLEQQNWAQRCDLRAVVAECSSAPPSDAAHSPPP